MSSVIDNILKRKSTIIGAAFSALHTYAAWETIDEFIRVKNGSLLKLVATPDWISISTLTIYLVGIITGIQLMRYKMSILKGTIICCLTFVTPLLFEFFYYLY